MNAQFEHGGNNAAVAEALGCRAWDLLDASASLSPWSLPRSLLRRLHARAWRDYPDPACRTLRQLIGACHGLAPERVIAGNGAAELFTWAARDAADAGLSVVYSPGFADHLRALHCWSAALRPVDLPLHFSASPQDFPSGCPAGAVLWITNPHNPTGQLWNRASLEPLLHRFQLVICDEAFLPLVPDGENHSLIPLLECNPNLVVIRSLTKLYGIAGLRLGYALAQPERLRRWAGWRDPWPVNGIAVAVGEHLLADSNAHRRWCRKVQGWTASEGAWWQQRLAELPGVTPMPSAANYLLIRGHGSLVPLRESLAANHHILLRDCRSFAGLGENWLRLGYQTRRHNRRILAALRLELSTAALV